MNTTKVLANCRQADIIELISQIKPTQIIPARIAKTNPSSALPVDLNPVQRNLLTLPSTTADNLQSDSSVDPNGIGNESSGPTAVATPTQLSTESTLVLSDPTPAVPAILSVKEQIIKFMPDGSAKIDMVLEVQDIEGAVEYDIRIAKDAGNL